MPMKTILQAFQAIANIVTTTPEWHVMSSTVEDSPWHREANVAVHTTMCIEFYLNNVLPKVQRTDSQVVRTLVALLFHDFGKPEAEETVERADGTPYRRYAGHESISANAMIDLVMRDTLLKDLLDACNVDLRAVKFMIENHLPYGMTNKTKLANLALAVQLNCDPDCFYDMLWSDCNGRISDDHEMKRQNVLNWIEMFKAVVPTKYRHTPVDQKTMFVLVGPVGAGKSTWIKERTAAFGGPEKFTVISEDDARERFFDREADEASKERVSYMTPKAAYTAMWQFAADAGSKFQAFVLAEQKDAVTSGKTLILDRTNRTRKARSAMIALARQHGYKITSVEFFVSLGTSVDRQRTRTDKSVPYTTVKNMFYQFQVPWFGVEVDEVQTVM